MTEISLPKNSSEKSILPQGKIVPLVPLRDVVIFPFTEIPLTFGRAKSNAAITAAFKSNRLVCLVCQKNPRIEIPGEEDLYNVGTLVAIEHIIENNGNIHTLVKGIVRVRIQKIIQTDPYFLAAVIEDKEEITETDELKALGRHVTDQVQRVFNLGKPIDVMILMRLLSGVSYAELANQTATFLDLKAPEKQKLLELSSINERLEKVAEKLSYEIKILELEKNIATKTQARFDKGMREAILRERKRTIEKELGELGAEDEDEKEIRELRDKITKAKMPPEVEKKAKEELNRLRKMSPGNPEAGYIRTYLDWLVAMPWSIESPSVVSLEKARKVLNQDHYGLEKVKERILEYLAVMQLKEKNQKKKNGEFAEKGPTILSFIGPPGVGKTSIGKSIAKALGRKFIRISLGGIRDEAEIRGHRRTYVGALPGRIIQGIKNAGTKNPVFMLDEIDKIGMDFRGDPSAALLEALDPEQNKEFSDHYLEVPFDLSQVFFIATGNVLDTIPPALRDRLEIIRFSGYTELEKVNIASKYLWKKQLKLNGLEDQNLVITTEALYEIIRRYTREAGVRELERNLASICRKIAKKIAEGKKFSTTVGEKEVKLFLGPPKFPRTVLEEKDEVGIATGMAWTEAGGEILFIEVALMPGKGALLLTGQLGDVMKESCQAAMSFVKSHYKKLGLKENFAQKNFLEVETPTLVSSPDPSPFNEVFKIEGEKLYLAPSPEFSLKKLLAAGLKNIYQITKAYRDWQENDPLHLSEFTILEWYRTEADYKDLMVDCEELINFISERLHNQTQGWNNFHLATKSKINFQGKKIDLTPPWKRISCKEAFEKYANIDLDEFLEIKKAREICQAKGYQVNEKNSWEELYHQVFLNEVEPKLPQDKPLILYDYPAPLAALAQIKKSNSKYAERFEFYIGGLELGNGYSELTDFQEQEKRLKEDIKIRKLKGMKVFDYDHEFIDALKSGLPKTAGIAVGVDRLVMLFTDSSNIHEVVPLGR